MATVYAYHTTGSNLYYKPSPLVTSTWSTGVVVGVENETTGEYSFNVGDNEKGVIFLRAGADPAASDIRLAQVETVPAPDNAGITANGVAIAALPVPPTAAAISIQIATDWDAGLNSWGDGLNALVDSYITPTLPSAVKHALFAANSQDKKISLSGGGNSYTPDSVIVDVRSIADQVISEDGAVKFKLFFGDDENYGPAKRLYDMTAGSFEGSTFTAQAFLDSGIATNAKVESEADRVINQLPDSELGAI
jgi:hypothetical protein